MTEHRDSLDDSFAKLLGRQPTDTDRQQLYRVRDALGLKNNDALWLVLMAQQYYQNQYEQFPQAIALAAGKILEQFKETADSTLNASVEAAKADLAKAIATTARDVASQTSRKQMFQWAAICFVSVCLSVGGLGWYIHNQAYKAGFSSGYGSAYAEAKDEKAAAAWANTPQGKLAYKLAQTSTFSNLVYCNNPGWRIENNACYPHQEKNNSPYGWWLPK
ncbi:MAG: DUF6753 family protein [Methylobacter sp.]